MNVKKNSEDPVEIRVVSECVTLKQNLTLEK